METPPRSDWLVRDVMTAPAVTVLADAGFKAVAAVLAAHKVSGVPVVDEFGRLEGILSEADLMLKEEHGAATAREARTTRRARARARATTARELMTAPVVTATPDEPLAAAAARMRRHQVKRLVVIDADGCAMGVVSRVDLLKPFLRDDEAILRDVDLVLRDVLFLEEAGLHRQVERGVVSVRGRVERRSDAEALRRLLARLPGVVAVEAEVAYARDDERSPIDPSSLWFTGAGSVPRGR